MARPWSPGIALGLVLAVYLTVTAAGCQQATSDPDAAVKALITSKTWDSDTTNYPIATFNETQLTIRFFADGSASYNGALRADVWSYSGGVFTITDTSGNSYTTSNPDITAAHFYFNYVSGLCHLVPKDDSLG